MEWLRRIDNASLFKSTIMKTNITISSLLFFICIGCCREAAVKQTSLDLSQVPSIELKAQSYPLDSALWAPDCIFTQGDYLIIEEGKRHTGIFRCFDAKNFDFLFACGTKGKGPNEVMHLLGQYILPCDSGFCVMDNGTEKEFQIKDGHLQVVCQSPIAIYDAVNGLAKIGDNHFFMNGYTYGSGAEHLIYKDGQITECGTYPESPYDDQQRFIMEFKTNVAQIGGDTIYSFYNNRNLIRKYSPQGELLEEDIALGRLWVAAEGEVLQGVFVFCPGPEPIYEESPDACWPQDGPYWVIHRIASAGLRKGAGSDCIRWCLGRCASLRIDTHPDNLPMQRTLEKLGFQPCGRVYYGDSPRVAFQKYGALHRG